MKKAKKAGINKKRNSLVLGKDYCLGEIVERKKLSLASIGMIITIVLVSNRNVLGQVSSKNIYLLKFPYPYRAAVTVCSDIDGAVVEKFEAVHRLINTDEHIERSSDTWNLLFDDPEIDKRQCWVDGINGFGLPIADSCWLYSNDIGVFKGFDVKLKNVVSHTHQGEDFRSIIGRWLQKGWIDSLHTPGQGHIPREATSLGLQWLKALPHRNPKVWVNHSASVTPSAISPSYTGPRVFVILTKNIIKTATATLCLIGAEKLARKIAFQPYPARFPAGKRIVCWIYTVLLVGSFLFGFISVCIKRFRKRRNLVISGLILISVVVFLYNIRLDYGQGDNRSSVYYNADLARENGFQFFWLNANIPGCPALTANTLMIPERNYGGRSSSLHVAELDDGSKCLVFGRTYKGAGGYQSLELLTDDALELLCDKQGTCILYTHWTSYYHKTIFDAKSLDGLACLRRFYNAGRVWVAPTWEILHFDFIRTFLEYEVKEQTNKRVINILRINNPVGPPFVPTIEDLRGISFECPAVDRRIELQIAGKPIEDNMVEILNNNCRTIVRIVLRQL